jgi:hypothetical protein
MIDSSNVPLLDVIVSFINEDLNINDYLRLSSDGGEQAVMFTPDRRTE